MYKKIIYTCILVLILFGYIIIKCINSNSIKNIYNSLVYIECSDDESVKIGNGFVYKIENNKNYILTNYHLIEGYYDIYVYNIKKNKTSAKVVNYDEESDIAILVIDDILKLKKASIDTSYNPKANDRVFIPSFNEYVDMQVNNGTIVGLSDVGYKFKTIKTTVNTDFGSSGSVLLNKDRKVIGMVFLKGDEGSFSIPISYIMDIIEKLEYESKNKVSLGATMIDANNKEILNNYGISIDNINGVVLINLDSNGILAKNGLMKGDIITSFNRIKIENISDLKRELYEHKRGDIVSIEYYRDGKNYNISIEL